MSVGVTIPNIWNNKTVPNHQPDIVGNNDITKDTHANPQPQWLLGLTSALGVVLAVGLQSWLNV
jgi:hypothetical protein